MKKILGNSEEIVIEYLAVCNAKNLEPLTLARGNMVLLVAVRLGDIRLIDNMLVKAFKKS
jgi:pantoate--beta-alanine ligase